MLVAFASVVSFLAGFIVAAVVLTITGTGRCEYCDCDYCHNFPDSYYDEDDDYGGASNG